MERIRASNVTHRRPLPMREGAQAKTRSFSYKQNVQKRFRPVPLFFFFLSLPLFRDSYIKEELGLRWNYRTRVPTFSKTVFCNRDFFESIIEKRIEGAKLFSIRTVAAANVDSNIYIARRIREVNNNPLFHELSPRQYLPLYHTFFISTARKHCDNTKSKFQHWRSEVKLPRGKKTRERKKREFQLQRGKKFKVKVLKKITFSDEKNVATRVLKKEEWRRHR